MGRTNEFFQILDFLLEAIVECLHFAFAGKSEMKAME